MALSKRERLIAIATAAVAGLLVADWVVITPWLEARDQVATELDAARQDALRAEQTFSNLRRANRRWAQLAGPHLTHDGSAAESQLLNALRDYAQSSGLTLTAVRPDRSQAAHGFSVVTVRATATGRMDSAAAFLWKLETAELPLRLTDLQMTTRTPGSDDLSLQLAVATLFLPPPDDASTTPAINRPSPTRSSR